MHSKESGKLSLQLKTISFRFQTSQCYVSDIKVKMYQNFSIIKLYIQYIRVAGCGCLSHMLEPYESNSKCS